MPVYSIALYLFFVANPIGNSPAIVALIKEFDFERQKKIMFRESIFALLLALFFQYCGELFLSQLNIKHFTVSLCGGILLFLVSLDMIFKPIQTSPTPPHLKKEPMFVPIATPLITGPGMLTIIMLYTQTENPIKISTAILLAWIGVTAVLVFSPYLQRILRRTGLIALEQLMGMILSMMGLEMIVSGIKLFIEEFLVT